MIRERRSIAARARRALAWALAGFAALQLGLSVLMDCWQPELRDPEFGYKLLRLRERLRESHQRPLMLVIGSSRAGLGFSPETTMAAVPERPDKPLVFNFGLTGAGPFQDYVCLQRLLRAGIRPRWLVIEVLPPILHQERIWGEARWMDVNRLSLSDLPLLRHNVDDLPDRYWKWLCSRLTPWFTHRFGLISRYAPDWLPMGARQDGWRGMDKFGWLPYNAARVTPEQYRRARDFAHEQYRHAFTHFYISEMPDRNLRKILDLCHREQITPLLVLMPEGSEFQAWYPPGARGEICRYLTSLRDQYQVPVVDARRWVADFAFFDSHHLLPDGAIDFSRRFAHEGVVPLLDDQFLKNSCR
jgi:hypothetical protein